MNNLKKLMIALLCALLFVSVAIAIVILAAGTEYGLPIVLGVLAVGIITELIYEKL